MKVFELLECRVCGQTPCNCTHITEGEAERKTNAMWAQITDYEKRAKATKDPIKKDHYMKMARDLREKLPTNEGYAPQGGNYKQGKYHVVVGGKCISEHPNKSEASSAAAKYRKANPSSQPRVKHESELTEGLADEIADKALNGRLSKMSQEEKVKSGWAHPSTIKGPSAAERKKSRDYQRSSTAKKAREAERRRGVNEDVTEGVKPNMRGVEAELAAHAQRKIDYEKENGPMVAHELFSHEQRRKQLLKKLSRERSKANNS